MSNRITDFAFQEVRREIEENYTREIAGKATDSMLSMLILSLFYERISDFQKNQEEFAPLIAKMIVAIPSSKMDTLEAKSLLAFLKATDFIKKQRVLDNLLYEAVSVGNLPLVKELIALGANVKTKNIIKLTPLHIACSEGHTEITRLLLEKGALVEAGDIGGQTPLHCASRAGHAEILSLLIRAKADVNAKDRHEQTPLHLAAHHGHIGVVQILLDNKAMVHTKSDLGKTALHCACHGKQGETVQLLLGSGASLWDVDRFGKTAYDYLDEAKATDIISQLPEIDQELGELSSLINRDAEEEIQQKIESWYQKENFIDILLKALSIPVIANRLITHHIDQIREHITSIPPSLKTTLLFLATPLEQIEILKGIPPQEKKAALNRTITMNDLSLPPKEMIALIKRQNLKEDLLQATIQTALGKIGPLVLALLMQDPQTSKTLISWLPLMTLEQISVITPHIPPKEWREQFVQLPSGTIRDQMVSSSLPSQFNALQYNDFIVRSYLSIEGRLSTIQRHLLSGTIDEKTYLQLSDLFNRCNVKNDTVEGHNTNILRLTQDEKFSSLEDSLKHPHLAEQKIRFMQFKTSIEQRIQRIEKLYAAVGSSLNVARKKYEVNIPEIYLDPVTFDLMIPEDCVIDPNTGKYCNRTSIYRKEDPKDLKLKYWSPHNLAPITKNLRDLPRPPKKFLDRLRALRTAQKQGPIPLRNTLNKLPK